MTKRNLLKLYLTGGAVAMLAAGCTPQQIDDTQKKLADLINQVQAAVAKGCETAGKIIPTANTVFAILVSLVGSSSAAAATAVMVQEAINAIIAVGCPAAPPVPTLGAKMTNKGIPVVFY